MSFFPSQKITFSSIRRLYSTYKAVSHGQPFTASHRVYIENNGKAISPFHDIPLYADQSNKEVFNMVVEIPRWTNAKIEIATKEKFNPLKQDIKKGKLRYVSNCYPYKGYIWNYGALPQTWEDPNQVHEETHARGDNDPIDVIEIGGNIGQSGEIKQVKVLGILAMLDEGETDWKVVAIDVNDPKASIMNDIKDVELNCPGLLDATRDWFKIYKVPDGKPFNSFAFDGKYKDKKYAHSIINETHEAWTKLIKGDIPHKTANYDINVHNTTVDGSPYQIESETLPMANTQQEQFTTGLNDILNQIAHAPDSDTIRNATSVLNTQYYTNSNCVSALVQIISHSPNVQIRQLAAVELRKKVSKWWIPLPEQMKHEIREQLMNIGLVEQSQAVSHSISRVIASIADIDMPDNKWPNLLAVLNNACVSQNAAHREFGIYCLYTLFEVISDVFMNNTDALFQLFSKMIVDPESKLVRITTVLVIGKLSEFISSEDKNTIRCFKEILPNMINVLEQCINDDDEENAGKIFEVFDNLLMLETPLLNDRLASLIDFFLNIGGNIKLDDSFRVFALSFLMWASAFKQNKIRQLKLVGHIIERLIPIGAETDPEDVDEDSPSRMAYKVLNSLANNIPPQKLFPVIMPLVINYSNNPNPNCRKAAMMAFAVTVEGCTDIIASRLNEILPTICAGLQDPENIVRRAACMALGSLADEIPDDVSEHHQTLLPLIFNLLNDNNVELIKHVCNALDAILKGLDSEIIQYLPQLMEKLLILLDRSIQTETSATIIAAIGSAALSAGEKFHPYFNQTIARIVQFMCLKESADDQILRGVATDAIGSIAEAVGAEMFRPYTQNVMALAVEQLQFKSPRLHECSFSLFSDLVRVFEDDFAVYLPTIMPYIMKACKMEEKDEVDLAEEIDLTTGDDGMGEAVDDDLELFNFNSAVADEKELAVNALGELFENTKTHFLPYVESSLEEIKVMLENPFEGVRKASVLTMFTFLRTFYAMSNPSDHWKPGFPATYTVHENVQHLISTAVPRVMALWSDEYDISVVVQICIELLSALRVVGPVVLMDKETLEEISKNLLDIFKKKSPCQQSYDDDDEEEGLQNSMYDEDDDLESETLLINAAADLVAALCESIGEGYAPSFSVFFPYISKYCSPTKSQTERSMAVGCLGECVAGLKSAITPYSETLLQIFIKGCGDQDEVVRSNAAFALGCLVMNTQMDIRSQYPAILTALFPLFSNQKIPNTVDNAAGAVARLIIAHPDAVPLDQVLPTFTNALPLKADFEENQVVFECLFKLFQSNNSFVFNNLSQYLHIFQQVLSSEGQLKELTRLHLVELVRALNTQNPALNIGSSELARYL
ncbi:armadillo-type protein [Pilobolus umbonatus]|nr:armadillo-type protein [Pilobolus umbonatus]